MDESLNFAQPWWIAVGLGLVVAGLLAFLRADRRRRADLDKLAHPRFHERLVAGWSPALRWTRRGLWLAAVMALALAAARPQFGHEWREVKRRGIDILFAVDTSRSMLAEDLVPNRLERARLGIVDFLERLEGDRVGLVPFAGTAFALCPLTVDYDAFRESLRALNTELIPQAGTDLASAIREAGRLFDAEGNNQRFLVLITDGEDLEGEAVKAAEEAAKEGTTIYTVGVGAADGQPIPVRGAYGRQEFLKDEKGEVVKTKLDATTLEKIASMTGGLYVPLGRGAEGLDAIYQQRLSLAPKSELAQKMEKVALERFQWPLGLAIAFLALQAVMGERRRERKSKALASVARRVRPAAMLLLALGISSMSGEAGGVADYNGGTEAYARGEFEEAVDKLKGSLATSDLEVQQKAYYNLGNSLYRVGQMGSGEDPKKTIESWEKALKAYDDALALDAADDDARYNRDLVQRKLDELKKQQEQKNPPQDPKDQDKKDEEKKDQEKQDQEKKDGEQGDEEQQGEPKDEQGKESEEGSEKDGKQGESEGKDGEKKDAESKDGKKAGEDKQGEEKSKDGQKADEGKDGEEEGMKGQQEKAPQEPAKPSGEAGEAKEGGKEGGKEGDAGSGSPTEVRKAGEMSREEAIRLLETLANDERLVIPVPLSERNREPQKGGTGTRKTW
jgi:Ca-activated chloride channel family protein